MSIPNIFGYSFLPQKNQSAFTGGGGSGKICGGPQLYCDFWKIKPIFKTFFKPFPKANALIDWSHNIGSLTNSDHNND